MYNGSTAAPGLRRRLLRWYDRRRRDLPWRRTRDPYAILVSEVMLQQTQAVRVVPAYASFLRRFPTLAALARAPLGDVLRAWSGLGYNRRARDIHRIARLHPRSLPTDREALDALPGIGAYTAGAVVCFSRGERVAFADTNIRRVLGRLALGRVASEREATRLDERLMPRAGAARGGGAPGRAAAWHHALMDLGATVCLARAPRCDACPLAPWCRARGRAAPEPRRRQRPFANSDRRVRGRIVAALRDAPEGLSVTQLRRTLADTRVTRLALTLEREGLLARRRGRVSLPD